jgi:hypothetical protein
VLSKYLKLHRVELARDNYVRRTCIKWRNGRKKEDRKERICRKMDAVTKERKEKRKRRILVFV